MDEDCKADSYYRKLRENCKTAIAPQIYRKVDALPWCIIRKEYKLIGHTRDPSKQK
jgi:hypothetical protein